MSEPPLPAAPIEGVDESMWLDVIQKMDEVYSQLVQDEIELERKNQELEHSQQFIFSVLSAMSDVLLVCDDRGRIEETNAALCEIVGRAEDSLRGTPLIELLADDGSRERARGVMSNPSRRGQAIELNLVDAAGAPVPVDVNCTPRIASNGRRLGNVFVGRPTAELQRAYQELRVAHEALKRAQQQLLHSEKMASLGRLVAGVAHELNNPISFVLGNVHALGKYSDRLRTYLAAIHAGEPADALAALRVKLRIEHLLNDLPSLIEGTLEGAQRTADIVDGLKRFSAKDKAEEEPFDLNDVVERAIHWISRGAGSRFVIDWTRGAPMRVLGIAGQIQQVVTNLLQNGIDATFGMQHAARIKVDMEVVGAKVVLRVIDNGPGIAPEHLSRIFDPFFTTKPVGKGTGLGLSISYGIAEQHGGSLSVDSTAGSSTVFTLLLPKES